jgi:hypothetical protein
MTTTGRWLPASLRAESVVILGHRSLPSVEDRLGRLSAVRHQGVSIRVRNGRVTAAAVPTGRTDIWTPVFKGRLTDHSNYVELSGVMRLSRISWGSVGLPFFLLILGLFPKTQMRWAIIGLALFSALVYWTGGPWFDGKNNRRRRESIHDLLHEAVAGTR